MAKLSSRYDLRSETFSFSFAMKAQLKVALVTLAIICFVGLMRYIDEMSNKDSVEDGLVVESDLESSTITDLLSEMKKGSMKREFSIEKKAEKSWQVARFDFYY